MTPTLFIGVAVSLLVTELTGYSPGGVIVAGYLSLFLFQPLWAGGNLDGGAADVCGGAPV